MSDGLDQCPAGRCHPKPAGLRSSRGLSSGRWSVSMVFVRPSRIANMSMCLRQLMRGATAAHVRFLPLSMDAMFWVASRSPRQRQEEPPVTTKRLEPQKCQHSGSEPKRSHLGRWPAPWAFVSATPLQCWLDGPWWERSFCQLRTRRKAPSAIAVAAELHLSARQGRCAKRRAKPAVFARRHELPTNTRSKHKSFQTFLC